MRFNPKKNTLFYWFIYALIFAVIYPVIIFSAIDSDTTGGFIYRWLLFSQPFTEKMQELVPAMNIYSEQIINYGDSWRILKFRNLYAVFWFSNIIAFSLLCQSIGQLINYYRSEGAVFKFEKMKEDKNILHRINIIFVCLLVLFTFISFEMSDSFLGNKLPYVTYIKDHYLQWPFVFSLSLYGVVAVSVMLIIVNIKYLAFRRNLHE